MKHRLAIPALLVASVLAVFGSAGCEEPKPGDSAEAVPAEVRIGYFANLTHAQAVLGAGTGEFEKAVVPAKFAKPKIFNAGPSLIEALLNDQIDIGYVGPGPTINGYLQSKGKGLRVISGVAANGVVIVAGKDSGITRLEDLPGKKIATPQVGNTQDIAARHYLLDVLKQKNTNNVIAVPNAEQSVMMKNGEIDAAWAPEPWGARLVAETGATIIAQEKDLWPSKEFGLTVIVVRPDFLAKYPKTVEKFLAVHADWTARLASDPAAQLALLDQNLADLTGKKLPPGVLADAIKRVKFTNDPLPDTLATMAKWSYELGYSKSQVDLTGLVDLSLINALAQSPAAAPAVSTTKAAP